ncbi:hypothetical protein N665_0104s0023 [Sinapis alba]|nr:hypothetical protein N665_0104s0023 [Sinapis alba]
MFNNQSLTLFLFFFFIFLQPTNQFEIIHSPAEVSLKNVGAVHVSTAVETPTPIAFPPLKETSQAPPSINDPLDNCATVSSDQPPPISHFDACNEKSEVEIVSNPCMDDLASLTTITELENMYVSPVFVCINEDIESPVMKTAQALPTNATPTTQDPFSIHKDCSGITEQVLGSNRFASLISSEGDEEDLSGSNLETGSMDLMTPFGKRILRERPVKPSTKARDAHIQLTCRGRGNRGRGSRGRSG